MKVKWFSDNNLKVLEVKAGRYMAVVKCEDSDGKIVFYAMTYGEDYHKYLGGSPVLKEAYKKIISKMEIDAERVEDYDCGAQSVFFLMAAEKSKKDSIDPDNPDAKGLIHFY